MEPDVWDPISLKEPGPNRDQFPETSELVPCETGGDGYPPYPPTRPSRPCEEGELILQAIRQAAISPSTIDAVECFSHGLLMQDAVEGEAPNARQNGRLNSASQLLRTSTKPQKVKLFAGGSTATKNSASQLLPAIGRGPCL